MAQEMKQAPRLEMWVIAAVVGLVAAFVAYGVGGSGTARAAIVGLVVALLVILAFWCVGADRTAVAAAESARVAETPRMEEPVAAPVLAATVSTAPVMAADPAAVAKPAGLAGARGGQTDDLKIIKGIGPKLEMLCHSLGFFHFDQVAGWTAGELAWVDDNLEGFRGRVTRDRWQQQALAIVAMGPEAFVRQLNAGKEF